MRLNPTLPILLLLAGPGCMYRIGRNVTDGILDEAISEERDGGLEVLADRLVEKQLAAQLGKQLAEGVTAGATDITPEERAKLEATIDGLLTVTTVRGADGIRRNLSPAMRDMVREDIVAALADGMRDKVGPQLEDTADRVITRAIVALRRGIDDPETRGVLSELIADSFYIAMREGGRTSPAVSDTIEATMTQSVLSPVEDSVGGIADQVALKVEEQARRTERTLQAIIAFLAVVLGALVLLFAVVQRQLTKERAQTREAELDLRTVTAAIGLLDEDTRSRLNGVLDEAHHTAPSAKGGGSPAAVKARRDDYERPPAPRDDYERKDKK